MLIESPLLTNHICSNYALKIVIQSALIPTSACSTTKQPSVATGSLDARPLNYSSWAVVPASKALFVDFVKLLLNGQGGAWRRPAMASWGGGVEKKCEHLS